MKCILIFDQLNDLLYIKCNTKFVKCAWKLARAQGLVPERSGGEQKLTSNIIIQLFSPIVTSQRIMTGQFGNSYSSIQCENGSNMVFNEYMGYLLMQIGTEPVSSLTRSLGVCTSFVKYLCGPNVPLLRSCPERCQLLTRILDTWQQLHDCDQAVLVEAVEQLMVNTDLSSATLKALKESVDKIVSKTDFSRVHALILVENKFLSLYSSRNAVDLSPADVVFLGLLTESLHSFPMDSSVLSSSDGESESDSGFIVDVKLQMGVRQALGGQANGSGGLRGLESFLILLAGNRPHAIHVSSLSDGVSLLLLLECGSDVVSSALNDAFHAINALQSLQNQKDMDNVTHAFHFLDTAMKRAFDGLKKTTKIVESCLKLLRTKWDGLRKKYLEFLKTPDPVCLMRIESSTTSFIDCLKNLHRLTCLNEAILSEHHSLIQGVHKDVRHRLQDFSDFLRVKALRNFTLGSRASLTINKYLEEFPGLVHFLYIDRNTHRLTAPSLDFSSEDTTFLTKKKIWFMIEFVRAHLQEGHLAMMWKDTTFNYAYFLWFEDSSGSPLKPKIYPTSVIKSCSMPGIMTEDFYRRLVEGCFPKMNPRKVQVYELFCIHLGLATASCVLEHSRRLAATIWEVTGVPSNPADFL